MKNIYNAIQNVYNMDKTTWQEVLAELYNLVSNVENKFDLFENKFGLLLGEEVTLELKKMFDNGSLASLFNDKLLKDINTKVDTFKTEVSEQLNTIESDIDDLKQNGTGGSIVNRIEPLNDDIPRIFLSEGTLPTTKDSTTMKIEYKSKTKTFSGYVDIKCQGTSSMYYAKKNFTIKLYEDKTKKVKMKQNFRDWGKQSKFCLKANWIDVSHARNIVSAKLWGDCVKSRENFEELPIELKTSPNYGAIDGFFVKVYSNGVYQGRYTMNIPKDGWMCNMDKNLDTHGILCGEEYSSGCFQTVNANLWSDELHDTMRTSIASSFENAQRFVINSSDLEFKSNLSVYFDVNSLIDYYCFHYAVCGLDGLGKNQLFFTYDGLHWIASSYDMDSTFGLYYSGKSFVSASYRMQEDYETMVDGRLGNKLYLRLEKIYAEEIKARYSQLREGALSVSNIINRFEDFMICNTDLINEDFSIFPNIPSQETNNIQQIRQYVVDRLNYVDNCINNLKPTFPSFTENVLVENHTGNGGMIDPPLYWGAIDFNKDYIEGYIDLSPIETHAAVNILSVGESVSYTNDWINNTKVLHMFYRKNISSIEVDILSSPVGQNMNRNYIQVDVSSPIKIKLDKNGIYINDVKVTSPILEDSNTTIEEKYIGAIVPLKTICINCCQGNDKNLAIIEKLSIFRGNTLPILPPVTDTEIVLVENHIGNGRMIDPPLYWGAIDFNKDYIEGYIDLSPIETHAAVNILSVGESVSYTNDWINYTKVLHMFYRKNISSIEVDILSSPVGQNMNRNYIQLDVSSPIKIKLDKNGIYINNVKVTSPILEDSNTTIEEKYIDAIVPLKTICINCCQGNDKNLAIIEKLSIFRGNTLTE